MKVYFASPFFNDEQIERERRLVSILRDLYFDVYAPSEHGVLTPNASDTDRQRIYEDNVTNLEQADICFCVTDGKDIGTIWEAGYFSCLKRSDNANKHVLVYYCETLGDRPFNVMLAKSGTYVITKQEDLYKLPAMICNKVKQNYVGKVQ